MTHAGRTGAAAFARHGQISLINSLRFISRVRPATAPDRLRLKTNFVSGFKLIWVVQSWR
jgi:hypothetical protein